MSTSIVGEGVRKDGEDFITSEILSEGPEEIDWIRAPHVISEINTFLVPSSDLKPIVKNTNRIARLAYSHPAHQQASLSVNVPGEDEPLAYDKDGDIILRRRRSSAGVMQVEDLNLFIEYENSTTLDLVGLQIWRGAFVLADFIIHNSSSIFKDKIIMELGSGTGLSSVVASFYASKVIATDLNEPDILSLIEANVKHNKKYVKSEVLVKPLDFTDLTWSKNLENCISETDIILAADVVYHNRITEAFVHTLKKCLNTGKPKNVFIALEKRYVFTISDLDVVSPMYDNFMDQLLSILALSPSESTEEEEGMELLPSATSSNSTETEMVVESAGANEPISSRYNLVPVSLKFPHYFNYERTKELVLWNIQPKKVIMK